MFIIVRSCSDGNRYSSFFFLWALNGKVSLFSIKVLISFSACLLHPLPISVQHHWERSYSLDAVKCLEAASFSQKQSIQQHDMKTCIHDLFIYLEVDSYNIESVSNKTITWSHIVSLSEKWSRRCFKVNAPYKPFRFWVSCNETQILIQKLSNLSETLS